MEVERCGYNRMNTHTHIHIHTHTAELRLIPKKNFFAVIKNSIPLYLLVRENY